MLTFACDAFRLLMLQVRGCGMSYDTCESWHNFNSCSHNHIHTRTYFYWTSCWGQDYVRLHHASCLQPLISGLLIQATSIIICAVVKRHLLFAEPTALRPSTYKARAVSTPPLVSSADLQMYVAAPDRTGWLSSTDFGSSK